MSFSKNSLPGKTVARTAIELEARGFAEEKNLASIISRDADRLANLRNTSNLDSHEAKEKSRSVSHNILNTYKQNSDKHSLSPSEQRRLTNHNIPFNTSIFNAQHTPEQNHRLVNKTISTQNEIKLAKLNYGKELASHYKSLGFTRGDYSQLTAKQFKESFDYIKRFKENSNSKAKKHALVLLSKKDLVQFDMTTKVEDIKELGFQPIFAQQLNTEANPKLTAIAKKLQGFDLIVSDIDSQDKDFLQEKSMLKDNGKLVDYSYNFKESSDDTIKTPTKKDNLLGSLDIGFDDE